MRFSMQSRRATLKTIGLSILLMIAGLVLSPNMLHAQDKQTSIPVKVATLSNAPSVAAPTNQPGAKTPSHAISIAERLRRHFASQAKQAPPAVKGSGPSLTSASEKNHFDVWLRPGAGTPRQIKLKPQARRQGRALMAASSGPPGKERDIQTAGAFLQANRSLLRIAKPDEELKLTQYEQDTLGRRHLRYRQSFQGLPVWPAELNVHLDDKGNVDLLNGAFAATPRRLVTTPVVEAARAEKTAMEAVPDGLGAGVNTPELFIYTFENRHARLAWRVEVKVSPAFDWLVIIDALNGAVLEAFNQVQTANVAGDGTDIFGQSRKLNVWSEDGRYYLVDASKSMYDATSDPPAPDKTRGAIIVGDMGNAELPQQGGSFQFSLITSTNPGTGWLADGVSLAYCLSETFDYYLERHGRDSIDGKKGSVLGFVRTGKGFKNAFWTSEYNAMFYGDAKPYAGALDVVAHELTHGITSYTCKLVYKDQSGALNESFSDIFGEMVEARSTGSTDWINGTLLNDNGRNLKNPGAVEIIANSGYRYPARMSEYFDRNHPLLQQLVNQDNGGVHINMTIVTHAFYLLAAGLDGAIGLEDAAKIFYRAQTVHLVAGSQFVDDRLACVTAAEELFGVDSPKVTKVKEAFDAVEIFDNPQTPTPPPTPPVSGPDSALFLRSDGWGYGLARYEESLGDPKWVSCNYVKGGRPSVTGDGTTAFFADTAFDACFVPTDGSACEECLGLPGYGVYVHSVAMSPDGQVYGFVVYDHETGNPTNEITVYDRRGGGEGTVTTFPLVAPSTEGGSLNTVQFADSMDFSSDNRFLIYDAYNVMRLQDGTKFGVWSIYALDLVNKQIYAVTEPTVKADVGFPCLSQTTNHLITFDVIDTATGNSRVMTMDLITGQAAQIGTVSGACGVPCYTGDDSAVVYSQADADAVSGYSLVRQPLAADHLSAAGNPTLFFSDADYGVVYRRGAFTTPSPNLEAAPSSLAYETVAVGGTSRKEVLVSNTGTADLRIGGLTITGPNTADFVLAGGCAGQLLPATGTCKIVLEFRPSSQGDKGAVLEIASDDPDTPQTRIPLSGTGSVVLTHTITASAGEHGSIAPSGAVSVKSGSDQSFTITPDPGYHIATLTVNGQPVTPVSTYAFTGVTADQTIAVTFAVNPVNVYTITATSGANGAISPSGGVSVNHGDSLTFTMTPNAGCRVANVTVNGKALGVITVYTFHNVASNQTIHVSFEELALPGDLDRNGGLDLRDLLIALKIAAGIKPDLPFDAVRDVNGDGRLGVPDAGYILRFIASPGMQRHTITTSAGENGTIRPAGPLTPAHGADQTFEIIPADGYHVGDVVVDGQSVGAVTVHTFNNIVSDHDIAAVFAINTMERHTIAATAGDHGAIEPAGAVLVNHGENQTFTISPDQGYQVNDVLVDGGSVGKATTYTFTNVGADHTIHAVMAAIQTQPPADITESEPNNTAEQAQKLGNLLSGGTMTISGRVDSGGIQGEQYTGDVDLYRLQLPDQVEIDLKMDWTDQADLDLAFSARGKILGGVHGSEKPVTLKGTMSAGEFLIIVGSKDNAAEYHLTIAASPSTAAYPNDNAILNGDYYQSGASLLWWYRFDGRTQFSYCGWNPHSGEVCLDWGTYEIWYPFLILNHASEDKKGQTDILALAFLSNSSISLNGVTYSK